MNSVGRDEEIEQDNCFRTIRLFMTTLSLL